MDLPKQIRRPYRFLSWFSDGRRTASPQDVPLSESGTYIPHWDGYSITPCIHLVNYKNVISQDKITYTNNPNSMKKGCDLLCP